MSLSNYTKEDLLLELERRGLAKILPTPLPVPNLEKLYRCIEDHLQSVSEGEEDLCDEEHYIFEAALEALYGNDIWDWYNTPR